MRLSKAEIDEVSRQILKKLKGTGLVKVNAPEDRVLQRIVDVIKGDLMAEDDLDREVEGMLAGYGKEFESGKMDYRKMFGMVKEKLVKERGLVI